MGSFSILSVVPQVFGLSVLLVLIRYVYRLTFHPLAKFNGPKLAAASRLYAASWDIPVASSFVKEFPRLHDKYGNHDLSLILSASDGAKVPSYESSPIISMCETWMLSTSMSGWHQPKRRS